MPKVIENVREQLLEETRKQIAENGYADTTIRSVAGACGLGVGTVYNYFKSKDMLIATFLMDDWMKHLASMQKLPRDNSETLFKGIYDSIWDFYNENIKIFSDTEAAKVAGIGYSDRHKMLRNQIADYILPICEKNKLEDIHFTAQFIAESIICWSMERVPFETVYPLLDRIINK